MTTNHLVRRFVVATALLAAFAGATRVGAIIIVGGRTGLFGLTARQTVRVSVLNATEDRGIVITGGKMFDEHATLLTEFGSDRRLRPGEGTFFDFDATALGLRGSQRMQVSVQVEVLGVNPPDDNRPTRPEDAILTLEVFDNATGKTEFTVPFHPPVPIASEERR